MKIPQRLRNLLEQASVAEAAHQRRAGISETIDLIRRYVIQETVGPLRGLLRMLALGVAGALLCGVGSIFVLVGVLRLLETETGRAFAGNWSFAPFLLTAAVGVGLLGLALHFGLRLLHTSNRVGMVS